MHKPNQKEKAKSWFCFLFSEKQAANAGAKLSSLTAALLFFTSFLLPIPIGIAFINMYGKYFTEREISFSLILVCHVEKRRKKKKWFFSSQSTLIKYFNMYTFRVPVNWAGRDVCDSSRRNIVARFGPRRQFSFTNSLIVWFIRSAWKPFVNEKCVTTFLGQ